MKLIVVILGLAVLLLAGCASNLHMAGYGCGKVVATRVTPGGTEQLIVEVVFYDVKGKAATDVLYVIPTRRYEHKVGDTVTLLMWEDAETVGRVSMSEIAKDSILCEDEYGTRANQ